MDNFKLNNYSMFWKEIFYESFVIAKETKFMQRTSKIDPSTFLKVIVSALSVYKTPSLKEYALIFQKITNEKLSPQGFDKRINNFTIEFMSDIIAKLISNRIGRTLRVPKLLQPFSEVFVTDSSSEELPESLKDSYAGSSGCASDAGFKLQYIFEVLSGQCRYFKITSASEPDQKHAMQLIEHISAGSLFLFDRGYISSDFLLKIISAGAYFVCRFPYYLFKVYSPMDPNVEINLKDALANYTDKTVVMNVLVGPKRIPARLVFYRVKKSVYQKRIQEARKNAKRKGRELSENQIWALGWTMIMTNTSEEQIRTKDLYMIYRLRWQIELIFKTYKSVLGLDEIKGKRKERIEFEILGRVILRLMYDSIKNALLKTSDEDVELSDYVCIKIFEKQLPSMVEKFCKPKGMTYELLILWGLLMEKGLKSKSKKKLSTYDLLDRHQKGGNSVIQLTDELLKPYESQSKKTNVAKRICRKRKIP